MRFALPEHRKRVYATGLAIRWGDMDALGHVNNANYFRYMETCRIDWLTSACGGVSRDGGNTLVVNAFCNFHRELAYPGELRLTLYTSNVGRSSYETWVTIERADQPGLIHADGGATMVWVDAASGRAAPLPDWLRAQVA